MLHFVPVFPSAMVVLTEEQNTPYLVKFCVLFKVLVCAVPFKPSNLVSFLTEPRSDPASDRVLAEALSWAFLDCSFNQPENQFIIMQNNSDKVTKPQINF